MDQRIYQLNRDAFFDDKKSYRLKQDAKKQLIGLCKIPKKRPGVCDAISSELQSSYVSQLYYDAFNDNNSNNIKESAKNELLKLCTTKDKKNKNECDKIPISDLQPTNILQLNNDAFFNNKINADAKQKAKNKLLEICKTDKSGPPDCAKISFNKLYPPISNSPPPDLFKLNHDAFFNTNINDNAKQNAKVQLASICKKDGSGPHDCRDIIAQGNLHK